MSMQFLMTISEQEFKELLRNTIREVLSGSESGITKSLPEILDVEQAAKLLNLKVNTLYDKTSRKMVPHFKKGNKLYFNRTELEKWISSGKVKTLEDIHAEAISFRMRRAA